MALMILTATQLLLGVSAFVAVFDRLGNAAGTDLPAPATADVVLTTAHQSTGALLLGCATALALLTRRLAATRPSA